MLKTGNASPIGLYRAGITSPERRRSMTVGREAILRETLGMLTQTAGKVPKHHCLFVAPRGFGKTHFLSLIEDEIHINAELSESYLVVRFPEEANRLLSFADFLLGICEILKDLLPESPTWKNLFDKLSTEGQDEIIIDTLVPALRNRYKTTGQVLVVMLENLNQLFDQQLKGTKAVAALRGFFMEDNGCLLMATAPTHFDGILNNKQPFYDFFDVQILDQLTEEETLELIRKNLEWESSSILARFSEMRPKILALYRMTGGSPRLTMMLYELIAHEAVSEVTAQLQVLLDRITPFYQDRLRDLSPQERAVLETIATMRDVVKTPKAIAERMRMKATQVSSLLSRLQNSHYLKSLENPKDKRSRLYVIREGFFDIWLAMNVSRVERQRLPFLVSFFDQFYASVEERREIRKKFQQGLKQGGDVKRSSAEALDFLSEVGNSEEKAIEKTKLAVLYVQDGDTNLAASYLREAKSLTPIGMGKWITDRTDSVQSADYLAEIEELISCWESHRDGDFEAFVGKLREMGGKLNYKNWSEVKIQFLTEHIFLVKNVDERLELRLQLGRLLSEQAKWTLAEEQLNAAVVDAEERGNSTLLAIVLNNLAQLYHATNCFEKAEPLMKRALGIDENSNGPDHPDVARDLNNLAALYQTTNRLEEAEPLMKRALDIDENSYGPDHPDVARDLNNLAQLYKATNRLEEAEPLMSRAFEIFSASLSNEHPNTKVVFNNLIALRRELGR
jgi:tetratricopeptide (TPR) repeat protein